MKQRRAYTSIRGVLWRRVRDRVVDWTPRVLRVSALLALMYAVAFAAAGRGAKADLHEMMLGFGAQMMRYEDSEGQGTPRQLYLNGQRMFLATATTRHAMDRVLDYYEARCMRRDGGFERELADLASGSDLPLGRAEEALLDATLRHDTGLRGFVTCIDMGENRIDVQELLRRLGEFADTGDLSKVGHLRYVYVTDDGDTRHLVQFWTDDVFEIGKMFPAEGDAPGRDVTDVPRPPGARRLLSAWEDGQPQSLTVYAFARTDAEGLQRFYARELPQRGWDVLDPQEAVRRYPQQAPPQLEGVRMFAIEKGDRAAFLVFGEDDAHQGTVTLLTSR
jgi:hypothetical protein